MYCPCEDTTEAAMWQHYLVNHGSDLYLFYTRLPAGDTVAVCSKCRTALPNDAVIALPNTFGCIQDCSAGEKVQCEMEHCETYLPNQKCLTSHQSVVHGADPGVKKFNHEGDSRIRIIPPGPSYWKNGSFIRYSAGETERRKLRTVSEVVQIENHVALVKKIAQCTGSSAFYDTPIEGFSMFHTPSPIFPYFDYLDEENYSAYVAADNEYSAEKTGQRIIDTFNATNPGAGRAAFIANEIDGFSTSFEDMLELRRWIPYFDLFLMVQDGTIIVKGNLGLYECVR